MNKPYQFPYLQRLENCACDGCQMIRQQMDQERMIRVIGYLVENRIVTIKTRPKARLRALQGARA